ncbi:GlcG/HbpS family heme-binding protein [Chryseolinea soli]|uniref:Heme-binding protein n=1 Tax=Chryseolinea soli TaxID=2321403 RepID=A0A385SRI0_9BACT|nr:heme-binding protein [Chryseolinea soli]AYB32575.1 heme-binding protein [Chryseolinea soli]
MKTILILALFAITISVNAQTQTKLVAYGPSITLEAAKKIVAAAEAFAVSKQYTVVVAIVDTGGNLVMLTKMDNTQLGSIEVAMGKAKTANNFKRPTKAFEDVVAGGGAGLKVLGLNVVPVEGGEPIYSADGKIIGAIGVSGMTSAQDGEVVKAALGNK